MSEPDGAFASVESSWIVLDPILGEIDQKLAKLNELLEQLLAIQRQAALSLCDETDDWSH